MTIRDVEAADLPIFFEQQLNPAANHMAAFVSANPQDRVAFDARWRRILSADGIVNKTILHDKEVAGHISCYP